MRPNSKRDVEEERIAQYTELLKKEEDQRTKEMIRLKIFRLNKKRLKVRVLQGRGG